MKENQIYWKTSSADNAKALLTALKDKYLVVQLAERLGGKKRPTIIRQFDSGMQYSNVEGLHRQREWIDDNPTHGMHRFYIIRSV